jgi:hypothetical protein
VKWHPHLGTIIFVLQINKCTFHLVSPMPDPGAYVGFLDIRAFIGIVQSEFSPRIFYKCLDRDSSLGGGGVSKGERDRRKK